MNYYYYYNLQEQVKDRGKRTLIWRTCYREYRRRFWHRNHRRRRRDCYQENPQNS
ncbi:hypothetical protein Hanom_Chr16g01440891 [Helianthus anomalus]